MEHAYTLPPKPMIECMEPADAKEKAQLNYEYDFEFLYMEQARNIQPPEETAPYRMRPLYEDSRMNDMNASSRKK